LGIQHLLALTTEVFWLQSLVDVAYFGRNTAPENPYATDDKTDAPLARKIQPKQNSPADYHTQKTYGNTQSAINANLLNLQHSVQIGHAARIGLCLRKFQP
jgi:hypothetical protein